ncbi:MAG: MFS transporter [Deltaproteobacteria bacterium]|nr:MFS transporter [Deltaproteobacteria bacterium]
MTAVAEPTPAEEGEPASTRAERFAWCLFDFANSAFPTVMVTVFFGKHFRDVIVGGPEGERWWGRAISLSMAIVAVSSPLVGALADRSGRKRPLLGLYVLVCVLATAGLAFVGPGDLLPAFALMVVANWAFEGAYVFYNAFLPELVPASRVGRLSGYGWAFGYVGGFFALLLIRGIVPAEAHPVVPGVAPALGPERWIPLVVAGWYALFALPVLLLLKDRGRREALGRGWVGRSFREVGKTARDVVRFRQVLILLVSYFLAVDALETVISFVAIFTGTVLRFTHGDNTTLFILMNVVAAPCAFGFGHLLDRIGGKKTLVIALLVWVSVVVGSVLVQSKTQFWGVATLAALVIGSTQSSYRAVLARIAPRERTTQFMAFLAVSGKASAILGPTLYGEISNAFHDPAQPGRGPRIAIAAVGSMFLLSLLVLSFFDEKKARDHAREPLSGPAEGSTSGAPDARR